MAFNFQSPASLADPMLKNQRHGAAALEILGSVIALMFGKSALNIGGDAGIQAAIPASEHVNIPIICILHEN